MKLSRRQVLSAAALVAGAGAVGVGATAWRWWDQPQGAGYAALSAVEAAFFDAVAGAVFPAGGEPALGGAEAGVSHYVDAVLMGMHPTQRKLLRVAAHAFENEPLLTHGGGFSTLPQPEATAVLRGWLDSGVFEIRGIAQSFYIFATMAYLAHPQVAVHLRDAFNCGFGRVE